MTLRKVLAHKRVGYLWLVVAIAFLIGLAAPAVQAQTAVAPTGTGTAANPYQITVLGNLVWMSVNVETEGSPGKYYQLMNDIDASDTANWSGGFTPIGTWHDYIRTPFRGVFEGQGHSISELVIDHPTSDSLGLFGWVSLDGEVADLTLAGGMVGGGSLVGALAARNDGTITNCDATGLVSGVESVGGLVGHNDFGTIANCHATGGVSGTAGDVGGLVGSTVAGTITNCYATGEVTGGESVGGLVGDSGSSAVTNCSATGRVTGGIGGADQLYVGGLVGSNAGMVTNSYATGDVTSTGNCVGGLLGATKNSTIMNSYATGRVSGVLSVGGLAGAKDHGDFMNCYATGGVSGSSLVGGLLGNNISGGPVMNCYAVGDVSGTSLVGGLVGSNYAEIMYCYAAGSVTGSSSVGGLVGVGGNCTNSYWNTQTSGQPNSDGGTGKTTAEMEQQATFVGWDFTNTWNIVENVSYPYFSRIQQPPQVSVNVSPASGAIGVALSPTLVASAFVDRNTTDTHAASQWQVRAATSPSSWTLTVFDSGPTAVALTSCNVSPGALVEQTGYLWRVRYEDNHGNWSAWSAPTTFQTMRQPPAIPAEVAASKGAFPDRVRVSWTGSPGASDYAVFRSTHPTTATATALTGWIDASAGTSYDDLTAEAGVIYYYWVVAAADATGASMSGFSARISGWAGSGVPFLSNRRGSIIIVH